MNQQQILKDRLYKFALQVITLVRSLPREMAGMEMGRQVLQSGTSIAANYEEAASAFSKEDFIYKISISFKESKETGLWLRLLKDSGLVRNAIMDALIQEANEISNILAQSLKTSRMNLKRKESFPDA